MGSLYKLKKSEPLVITEDGVTVSKLKINNPEGFAIIIKANCVTIQECDIVGAINIYGPVRDIVIRNNLIHDLEPRGNQNYIKQFAGIMTTEGNRWDNPLLQPMGASGITITGNYFRNCPTGAYLVECKGPILFRGNYSCNHRGPFPRGQMVQLALCDGTMAPITIENNFSYVDPESVDQKDKEFTGMGAEDHINVYNSMGSEAFPITVRENYIYGCSSGVSGSGIMMGDGGGSYYQAIGNRVFSTGNAGIGASGGHHILIKDNLIYQNPPASHYNGKGLQIDNYGDPYDSPIIVENNKVYWACGKGDGSMLCMADSFVEFKSNSFGDLAVFEESSPLPPHVPPEPDKNLIKPWECLDDENL